MYSGSQASPKRVFSLAAIECQSRTFPCVALGYGLVLSLKLGIQVGDLIDELAAPFAFRRLVGFRAEGFSLGTEVVLDELLALASSGGMERCPFGLGTSCHISCYCVRGKFWQFARYFFALPSASGVGVTRHP
jgi:hypothetical protein